MLEVSYY